ncbi:MAG: RHS repeat-associated core domain-containing protein [Bacteroidales bacterium]|nr:RHS repeat-associated core domain-containing protein [Bacteroidales bacterium]
MNQPAHKTNLRNCTFFGHFSELSFTGKERDEETGYGYLGARYYDSDLSGLFLSIDPMSDKYPNISPYAYCAWNPVKLVDPNGMDTIFVNNEARKIFNSVYDRVSKEVDRLERKQKTTSSQYQSLKKMKDAFTDVINSSTKFYFKSVDKDEKGNTLLKGGNTYGKVGVTGICVDFANYYEGSFIHELRHAAGYKNGEWDIDLSKIDEYGHFYLINYDYQDEYEAYYLENRYNHHFNNELLKEDYEIKTEVRKYSSYTNIIPEFIQYSRVNPYKPHN